MRFKKMLIVMRTLRISAVVAGMLAAGSGCATEAASSDEQEIGQHGRGGEQAPAVTVDLHAKASSMLDVSGGASEDTGGYPYCDQGEVFVGTGRSVVNGSNAACDAARDDAVSQCEATECFDRDQWRVRAFNCDPPPSGCRWQSTWYGTYAEFTIQGD